MRNTTWLLPSILVLTPLAPASGADLWVSPVGDYATITSAMAAAGAGDRILVEAGTYFENIAVTDGVELRGGYAPGDSSEASRNPTVHVTIINGSGVGSAVTTGPGAGSDTIVDGFGLTGAGGSPGSAIVAVGGSPVFSNNDVFDNLAGGLAGGAYARSGSSARFEDNAFRRNSSGGSGGGIRADGSPITITGNTFDDNQAAHGGGGVYAIRSDITCSNNTFNNCRAGDNGGGGLYFQEAPGGTVSGNDFTACAASRGGGVMIRDESIVTLEDNDFENCSALRAIDGTGNGGGVAIYNFSEVTMRNNRFSNCTAEEQGGGVYVWKSRFDILGNDATDANSLASFSSCTADSGGALYAFETEGSTFSDQRISDCSATFTGGGIFLYTCQMTLSENVFERCVADDGGGVAFFSNRSTPPPPQSFFLNNTMYKCNTRSGGGNPGGGILHQAVGFQTDIAVISGNLITHTEVGSCIRCRAVGGGGASRPTIHCSSFHLADGNPADVIGNPQCQGAFASGINNKAIGEPGNNAYSGPDYCDEVSLHLRDCEENVDVGTLCSTALPGRVNRGVTDATCACLIVSVERSSWGEIKARYR